MLESKNQISDSSEVEDMTQDYIAAINELKQNSVDRNKYDELRAENKKLLQAVVNGQQPEQVSNVPKKSIEELRKEWLDENNTNLQYIERTLALREALMSEGKPDPFLPVGSQILPDDADIAAANKVATVLQECIDYANGDSSVFTNELQRRLVDVKTR